MTDNTQELDEILALLDARMPQPKTMNEYTARVAMLRGTKQAILDWHNKQVEEVLDRVEGLAELTESYRQGSRLACKNCGTETRGEFLVPAFQAIPLSTIQALRKELDGGQSDGVQ